MQVDPDGRGREAGAFGDLRAGKPFDEPQYQRVPVGLRQGANHVKDRERFGSLGGRVPGFQRVRKLYDVRTFPVISPSPDSV